MFLYYLESFLNSSFKTYGTLYIVFSGMLHELCPMTYKLGTVLFTNCHNGIVS